MLPVVAVKITLSGPMIGEIGPVDPAETNVGVNLYEMFDSCELADALSVTVAVWADVPVALTVNAGVAVT